MTRRKYTIPRRRHPGQFIEPTTTVAYARCLERQLFRSLQQAAHCHIFPDRARRARRILEQIDAEKVATRRRPHIGQTAATPPSPAPTTERRASPGRHRHGWRALVTVGRWRYAATRRVMGIYSRIHGPSIVGQPGPGRRSKRVVTR